jgi:hypothetical protein
MKRILALVVLAVLGFATAGCGSGEKARTSHVVKFVSGPHGIRVVGRGTARLAHLKPGTRVSCKGAPAVTVPYDTSSVAAVRGPVERSIKLTRSLNGTVTVSCGR